MARAKKIDEEVKDSKAKVETIEQETDINEISEEAESINNVIFKVWDKDFTADELIDILNKDNKTYDEKELAKQFKMIIKNYYDGIMHAVLRTCCGRKYSLLDLKNKLTEEDIYRIIDIRCSRNYIRFNKETVDKVIDIVEQYNLDQ